MEPEITLEEVVEILRDSGTSTKHDPRKPIAPIVDAAGALNELECRRLGVSKRILGRHETPMFVELCISDKYLISTSRPRIATDSDATDRAAGNVVGKACVWNHESRRLIWEEEVPPPVPKPSFSGLMADLLLGFDESRFRAALTRDGSRFCLVYDEGIAGSKSLRDVRIYDITDSDEVRLLSQFTPPFSHTTPICFTHQDDRLFVTGRVSIAFQIGGRGRNRNQLDGRLSLFDVRSGEEVVEATQHMLFAGVGADGMAAAQSLDGEFFAGGTFGAGARGSPYATR
jgi:hypothetical protein